MIELAQAHIFLKIILSVSPSSSAGSATMGSQAQGKKKKYLSNYYRENKRASLEMDTFFKWIAYTYEKRGCRSNIYRQFGEENAVQTSVGRSKRVYFQ